MFSYDFTDILRKKLYKLGKKDRVLAENIKKKILEITSRDKNTVDAYKNLKSQKQEYKRIHLTDNFILIFHVDKNEMHIVFIDVLHWDNAYR